MNATSSLPSALAVVRDFGRYTKGELITDADAVRAIWTGGCRAHVVPTVPPAGEHAEPARED